MTRQYLVIYEWAGKNFSGYAPDIPGCMATARTLPRMRAQLRSALESHLQWMQDDGDSIPASSKTTTVDLEDDPEFPNPLGYYVVVEELEVTLPRKKRTARKTSLRQLTAA